MAADDLSKYGDPMSCLISANLGPVGNFIKCRLIGNNLRMFSWELANVFKRKGDKQVKKGGRRAIEALTH
jgi:hypothetical protein